MKQLLLIGLLVIGITVFAAPVFALNLGAAGDYNAFIFGSFTGWNSDVEGRLAAGGNVSLTSYSVVLSFPTSTTLAASGNLTLTNGRVNGNAVLGGTASVTSGTVTGTTTQHATGLPVNFAAEKNYLIGLSNTLKSTTANGNVAYSYGGISITGDSTSALQVFNIDGSKLVTGGYFNTITNIPKDATLVLNVSGTSDSMMWMGMTSLLSYQNHILFNFYEAKSLNMSGATGSILAPYAAVTANYGNINGTIIAASWNGTSQLANVPFKSSTPVPLPGAVILFSSGLVGLVGLRRRLMK